MRKIGTIPNGDHARRFHRYLAGHGIESRVDQQGDQWEVWVLDEDQVPTARGDLDAFYEQPDARRFTSPPPIPEKKPEPVVAPARPVRRTRGNPKTPLTVTLIAISIAVTIATNFGKNLDLFAEFAMTAYGGQFAFIELRSGQFWRLYTPMFVHLHPLHLIFNLYMCWILAGVIERVKGTWTLLLLVLLIAPISHLAQYVVAGPNFGGLSGVLYGLFGYLWMRSVLLPNDGFFIPQIVVVQLIIWAMLGLTGFLHMANGAHFGGLFAGMALGALPRLWRE